MAIVLPRNSSFPQMELVDELVVSECLSHQQAGGSTSFTEKRQFSFAEKCVLRGLIVKGGLESLT